MCGFFCIISKNANRLDKKKIFNAAKLIAHRGPDDNHSISSNNYIFSFYRLSLRDLSISGRQPMYSSCNRFVICFNGEIYNSEYLRSKYLPNFIFKGTSDTEILLELYKARGEKIIRELEGMFSMLIYDNLSNKALLARDRIGIKPLYFKKISGGLIVSSEIKPILKYSNEVSMNYSAFAEFFLRGSMDHDKTFFKNIEVVMPGTFLFYKNNNFKSQKYWDIKKIIKLKNKKKNIKNLLNDSIKKHLISDVKIGSFLSGGTDSSLITSLANKKLDYKISTFTYDFSNSENFSESERAKKIANQIGVYNKNVKIDHKFVLENFDKLIKGVESPITSIRLFGIYKNYITAKEKKIKVILEGQGGDEIFAGYDYNYIFYFKDLIKNLTKKNALKLFLKDKNLKINSINDLINFYITSTNQYGSTSDGVPYINSELFNKDFLNDHLNEEFYNQKKITTSYLIDSQIRDLTEIKLPRVLKYTDRLSMMNGVETRVPLLDNNIINYGIGLKSNYKFKNGKSRWILKKELKLGFDFQKNKKTIVDPQNSWLKNQLKDYVYDSIHSKSFIENEIFNSKNVHKYYLNYLNQNHETSFNLLQILSFHRFMEIFKKLN